MCESVATSCLPMPQLSFIVSTPLFPTLSLPCEMAGHQLYLQTIAAGTVSGSPGSGGPNLQLWPQMMQPMSLVPSPNSQPTPFAPFCMMPYGGLPNFGNPMSVMPYGGLPNFGNATAGSLMPFMAQNSMPSSLPEPQPARAADAAATTPSAASSTNPHPTGTRPQSHSRRSRSRHRRHRHSHSHTSHHRGHEKSPRRHTTQRARSSSRSHSPSRPHHRSMRSRRNPISPPLTLPPAQVLPTTLPRTQDHGSTSSLANPHLPRFHFLAHFRMAHRQVSKVLWNQSWGHPPQSHSTSRWGKRRHSTSNTGNWSSQDERQSWPQQQPGQQPHPPIPCWPQQRQHAPYPCTRGGFPNPPSPPCTSPTLPPAPLG